MCIDNHDLISFQTLYQKRAADRFFSKGTAMKAPLLSCLEHHIRKIVCACRCVKCFQKVSKHFSSKG